MCDVRAHRSKRMLWWSIDGNEIAKAALILGHRGFNMDLLDRHSGNMITHVAARGRTSIPHKLLPK